MNAKKAKMLRRSAESMTVGEQSRDYVVGERGQPILSEVGVFSRYKGEPTTVSSQCTRGVYRGMKRGMKCLKRTG